jgi:hypothetical protein
VVIARRRRGCGGDGVEGVVDGLVVLHQHQRVVHVVRREVGETMSREGALRVVPEVAAQLGVAEERLQELHQGQRLGHRARLRARG